MNVVGKIVDTPAIYSDDGERIDQAATYCEGWHVNSLVEIPDFSEYLLATPSDPVRVYYGVPPEQSYFYRFPDEAKYLELLSELKEDEDE